MSAISVVILIVIIVIIWLVVWLIQLEVVRSLSLGSMDKLYQKDQCYKDLPRVKSRHRVVISMTTTPDRINVINPTILSILDQTCRVDEICINVPRVSRKGDKYRVPKWLKKLSSVTIHRINEDLGPSSKLIPTLERETKDTRIIVIDDDNLYHSETVALLIKKFEHENKHKRTAITHFGVLLNDCGIIPDFFTVTRSISMFCGSRQVDLLQGCHGFVVTPGFFPKAALELEDRPKDAISVDDIWFSCWLQLNGVDIITAGSTFKHMPLVNFGEVNGTVKLVNGENKGLIRDQNTMNWFMKKHNYVPVRIRNNR